MDIAERRESVAAVPFSGSKTVITSIADIKISICKTAALALAAAITCGLPAAQAAPVTWLFGGSVISVAPGSGGGFPPSPGDPTLSNMFDIGDPFELAFTFDDANPGVQDIGIFGPLPARTYFDDVLHALDIDGHIFTLSAPDIAGNNQRRVFNQGTTEALQADTDDFTTGNATSSIAGVDRVFLDWEIENFVDNILPDVAPSAVVFPDAINHADWGGGLFELTILDNDIGAQATVQGLFDTFEVAGTGVPAPGALVLIGFGLLGFAGLRRRAT